MKNTSQDRIGRKTAKLTKIQAELIRHRLIYRHCTRIYICMYVLAIYQLTPGHQLSNRASQIKHIQRNVL